MGKATIFAVYKACNLAPLNTINIIYKQFINRRLKNEGKERKAVLERREQRNEEYQRSFENCQGCWSAGYKQAFAEYKITFDMLDVPTILAMCQKNEQGEFVLNKDGKRVYEQTVKVVTVWSATTLWNILDQTRGSK